MFSSPRPSDSGSCAFNLNSTSFCHLDDVACLEDPNTNSLQLLDNAVADKPNFLAYNSSDFQALIYMFNNT